MRAISIRAASTWSGNAADRVVLDYDGRRRRRFSMQGAKGLAFLLDLPAAASLQAGDALVLEDGRLVEVVAAAEPLLEIRCADAAHLARVAWHFGNRHLPTQVLANALRVRRDHVIADLAVRLGARVSEIEAPFEPEGGAYTADRDPHDARDHRHADAHTQQNGHDRGR